VSGILIIKSLAQVTVANSVLDYYMREKHLENAIKYATEMSIVLGSGFIKLEWNATSGEAYDIDPDTGEFNYEGEIEFSNLSPFDVVVDGTKETWDNEWILVRTFKNRYDLMAKYPEMADKIKGLPPKNQSAVYRLAVFSNDETDDIPVYEFFHKKNRSDAKRTLHTFSRCRYCSFGCADAISSHPCVPYCPFYDYGNALWVYPHVRCFPHPGRH
jgi:hypothetical protein